MLDFLARFRRAERAPDDTPTTDEPVKVILGLGNPGRKYESTRHNVGWWVLDHLAEAWHFGGWKKDGNSLVATGAVDNFRARLVKPQTYMNLSGAALRPYMRRPFWAASKDLMVVVDEVALPLGRFRVRARGSAGGHNGLKSVQQTVGGQEYARLRIGIRPVDEQRVIGDLSDFVLSSFGKAERSEIATLMPTFAGAIELWMREGIEAAMNTYNRLGGG